MLQLKESPVKNAIKKELLPLFIKYKKSSAAALDINALAEYVSAMLEDWEYTPKKIKFLDRKAFFDLLKECYMKSLDKKVFTKVFDF